MVSFVGLYENSVGWQTLRSLVFVDLDYSARDGSVYVGRYEAAGLGYDLTALYVVAFSYLSHGGSADVLRKGYYYFEREIYCLHGLTGCGFELARMDTAYFESLHDGS